VTAPATATAFSIRAGQPADAEVLASIGRRMFALAHQDAFAYAEDLELVLDRDWLTAVLARELQDDAVRIFVAEVEGRPVGLTGLRHGPVPGRDQTSLEVCRVYLEQEHFGKGIGAALLDTALASADAGGAPHTYLIAWERNDRAIPLYLRRGFVQMYTFPYTVGRSAPAAVLMERTRPLTTG
jgi:ribosomal protein S18 acetylase RimI-like enzyme